jgi:hypothetical protein
MATSQSHTAGHLTTALTTPLLCGCVQAVAGRHCLMIDDLCDSGLTLMSVRDRLLEAGAASVKSVVLLDKRARRKVGGGGQDQVVNEWVVRWWGQQGAASHCCQCGIGCWKQGPRRSRAWYCWIRRHSARCVVGWGRRSSRLCELVSMRQVQKYLLWCSGVPALVRPLGGNCREAWHTNRAVLLTHAYVQSPVCVYG